MYVYVEGLTNDCFMFLNNSHDLTNVMRQSNQGLSYSVFCIVNNVNIFCK